MTFYNLKTSNTNNVTNSKTLLEDFFEKKYWDSKWEQKWRVYNCNFCGWTFYSHMKSNLLRCVACEYKIQFETFDCSDCRTFIEPDNCVIGNSCNQLLCNGKIIKCNNAVGIYYKDWNDLLSSEEFCLPCFMYSGIKCTHCKLPYTISNLISKNQIQSNQCVNCENSFLI